MRVGKRLNHNGYCEVYMPDHHRARGNGYVFEHIIVLEEKIGRRLIKGEQVHHVNEIKNDNRPENLELVSIGEHTRIHAPSKRKGEYKKCDYCQKTYYVKPSHAKRSRFCSRKCVGLSSSIEFVNNKMITKTELIEALENNDWHKKKAAKELGVHWTTVYQKLKKLGVKANA